MVEIIIPVFHSVSDRMEHQYNYFTERFQEVLSMLTEKLLKSPGFLYQIGSTYYYLGKWICKECTDTDATDCVMMYHMCRGGREEPDTGLYFNKIRAYSDFALEVPCNPAKTKSDITALIEGLSDSALDSLVKDVQCFEEDYAKYCGNI